MKLFLQKASVQAAFVFAGLVFLAGCDSITNFQEINENPNDPTEVESALQLPAVLTEFSYEVVGNEAVRIPSLWVQQASQNDDPPNADSYQQTESDVNNLWEFFIYTGALKDARQMQETARAEENFATVGIGQIIEAWSWVILTDLFGDIPFEEAFQPNEITNPAYSDQETVYEGVFTLLADARQNLNEGNVTPLGGEDLLYGGDLDKWESLAWALEAKFHIHLTESGFSAGLDGGGGAQARAQAALDAAQNAFPNGNADNPSFVFPGGEDKENPWFQFTIQGVWVTDHQLSANYIGLLKDHQDPRIGIQARQTGAIDAQSDPPYAPDGFAPEPFNPAEHFDEADDTYVGHENGTDAVSVRNVSSIGSYYSADDAPLIWMNFAEVKFIEAEAQHIVGDNGAARQAFEDGIRASMEQLDVTSLNGVDQAFVDAFVSDRLSDYDSAPDPLEEIITEKYVANFIGLEPYNDWRRTGYPELTPVPAEVAATEGGVIPLRYPYPISEYNNNANNVPADIGRGVQALDAPVPWDQD